jgi:hypothetical protein
MNKTNEQVACNNFEKIGIIKGRRQMKEEVIQFLNKRCVHCMIAEELKEKLK